MLEGPESPKSPHKLVLPEKGSISAVYTVIMGEMNPKVAKLVNLAKTGLRININIISAFFLFLENIFFIFVCYTNHYNKKMCFRNIYYKKLFNFHQKVLKMPKMAIFHCLRHSGGPRKHLREVRICKYWGENCAEHHQIHQIAWIYYAILNLVTWPKSAPPYSK